MLAQIPLPRTRAAHRSPTWPAASNTSCFLWAEALSSRSWLRLPF